MVWEFGFGVDGFVLVLQFVVVVVKYINFCGVVIGVLIFVVLMWVLDVDWVSVFGGIIVINGVVEVMVVCEFISLFLECVVVLGFMFEVWEVLVVKVNLCLLELVLQVIDLVGFDYVCSILGGFLVQDFDDQVIKLVDWIVVSQWLFIL